MSNLYYVSSGLNGFHTLKTVASQRNSSKMCFNYKYARLF